MDVQMLVVQGKQRGKFLRFPNGEFVFGRGPECHVRPISESISRQHCLLRVGSDGAHIRDLGSTNGTLINGIRVVGDYMLKPGDELQLGPMVLRVVVDEPEVPEEVREGQRDTKILARDTISDAEPKEQSPPK